MEHATRPRAGGRGGDPRRIVRRQPVARGVKAPLVDAIQLRSVENTNLPLGSLAIIWACGPLWIADGEAAVHRRRRFGRARRALLLLHRAGGAQATSASIGKIATLLLT